MPSFVDFQAVKDSVSVEAAIPMFGLSLKQSNGQYRGPCPGCESGGDRALVITPAKNAFYCFGERVGGDVIALAAHIKGCGVKEAAAFLDACISKGGEGGACSTGNGIDDTVPKERQKGDVRSLRPLSYLEAAHESVRRLGLDEETCLQFGAGYAPKGIMRGRLAIPIHNLDGQLIAYCGRPVEGSSSELSFPKNFDPVAHVFNAHQVGEGELALLRDPLEVLQAWQNGITNATSFLTQTINPDQLELLADLMRRRSCGQLQVA